MSKKHRDPVAKERAEKLMSFSLRLELEWLRSVMHVQNVLRPIVWNEI
jgi:hypothetical protein